MGSDDDYDSPFCVSLAGIEGPERGIYLHWHFGVHIALFLYGGDR